MPAEFDTLEDAAAGAQDQINRKEDSSKFEFMSVIFQDPDTKKFKFTDPKTTESRGDFNLKVRIPKGSLRAVFHNHPASVFGSGNDDFRQFFSPEDIKISEALGVKSFIGVDNNLLQFDPERPGDRKTLRINGRKVRAREGEEVLAKIPTNNFPQKREATRRLAAIETKAKDTLR